MTRIDTPQGYHQLNGYTDGGLRAWKNFFQVWAQGGGEPTGTRTYFYYDGSTPAFETDANGNLKAINVFAPDGLVARGTVGQSGTTYKYYSFDSQGSVVHRSSASGTITQSAMYDAYGKQVQVPGPNNASDAFGWNGRWGYYQDTDTGLILCTYRYYDASQGRWLTRDPIGYVGGINLYGYCDNGPIGGNDPLGLWSLWRWLYTGDGDASNDVYESGLNQGWQTLKNWWGHFKDANSKLWSLVAGGGAAGSAPYWSVQKPPNLIFPGGGEKSSVARICAIKLRELLGSRNLIYRGAHGLADLVKSQSIASGGVRAAGSAGVVAALYVEAGLAWYATYETFQDSLYEPE